MAMIVARRVSVPSGLLAAARLDRVDYADAYALPDAGRRDAERWLRSVLGGSGPGIRAVRAIWLAVGAEMAPLETPGHLFGCPLTVEGPHRARVEVRWRTGLHGTILLDRSEGAVVFATVIRLANPGVRALWAVVAPLHRASARAGLSLAAARIPGRAARRSATPDHVLQRQ
jgi:hypothetical protein